MVGVCVAWPSLSAAGDLKEFAQLTNRQWKTSRPEGTLCAYTKRRRHVSLELPVVEGLCCFGVKEAASLRDSQWDAVTPDVQKDIVRRVFC